MRARRGAPPSVDQLRADGIPVKDEDAARLSPLGHVHLNVLGRYSALGTGGLAYVR